MLQITTGESSQERNDLAEILIMLEAQLKEILTYYDERETSVSPRIRSATEEYLHKLKDVFAEIHTIICARHDPRFFPLLGELQRIEELRRWCVMDVQAFNLDYNRVQTRQRLQTMQHLEKKLLGILAGIQKMQTLIPSEKV